jgi:phosphoenolpyruvate carboxykinase (GTP)
MGVVRRDPFAMLPFIGYNMSDYFQHWLDMGEKMGKIDRGPAEDLLRQLVPHRRGGKFVWPGFGDNMRVLKWMLERIEGKAGGIENIFGTTPRFGDLNWDGFHSRRKSSKPSPRSTRPPGAKN